MTPFAPISGADRSDDGLLADLVEELTERLHDGDAATPDDLLHQHPEHAEKLRQLLPALQALVGVAVPPPRHVPPQAELPYGVLGDFRLLREIGRGGMGVVYEAEQISLNRRVALKVLPFAAGLDPRQLQRFKTEAQAAANLHHDHIVPVYAVGCERGVHYFAMQYIDGTTLSQTIAELRRHAGLPPMAADPSDSVSSSNGAESDPDRTTLLPAHPVPDGLPARRSPGSTAHDSFHARTTVGPRKDAGFVRTVAGWGVQAAQALDFAHQCGVVHRDVKPANLIVDGQGKLWVTDFGLARFAQDTGPTKTGEVLGTLRYMSPEQASARHGVVDHRTDVYALGVTLYELLTLEPAHAGRNQHDLLARVLGDEVRPPRRHNPAIPVELETVILKAVAKDAAERYATAQELADDLGRFLNDQPVRARRPTPAERMTRWGRRHRRIVRAAALGTVLALAALTVTTVLFLRQRDEAEARRQQARRVVDRMWTQVGEKLLIQEPHLELVHRAFLMEALEFYREFSRTSGRDPSVRLETGTALRRVADIRDALGESAPAAAAYDEAVEHLRHLATDHPDLADARGEWAVALTHRGNLRRANGRPGDAEQDYRQAFALFTRLTEEVPDAAAYREGLAGSGVNLGAILHARGHHRDAEALYHRSATVLQRLLDDDPTAPSLRHAAAGCANDWGVLLRDTGRLAEAERELDRAASLEQILLVDFRTFPAYRRASATAQFNLAQTRAAAGRTADALTAGRAALADRERLVADFPRVVAYQADLAAAHHAVGVLEAGEGRYQEAEKSLNQAVALRSKLAAEHPNQPEYRRELAESHHAVGSLSAAGGRWAAAEQAFRAALAARERLAVDVPAEPHHRLELGRTRHGLGWVIANRGHVGEAEHLYRQALAAFEEGPVADGPAGRGAMAAVEYDLGRLLRSTGRHADAETALQRCRARAEALTADYPGWPTFRDLRANACGELAALALDAGRADDAAAAYRDALAVRRKLAEDYASVPRYNSELAWLLATCPDAGLRDPAEAVAAARAAVDRAAHDGLHWTRLGVALYRAGDWAGAAAALDQAVQRRRGGDRVDWLFLALAHRRLGHDRAAREWFAKATAEAQAGVAPNSEWTRLRAEAAVVLGP